MPDTGQLDTLLKGVSVSVRCRRTGWTCPDNVPLSGVGHVGHTHSPHFPMAPIDWSFCEARRRTSFGLGPDGAACLTSRGATTALHSPSGKRVNNFGSALPIATPHELGKKILDENWKNLSLPNTGRVGSPIFGPRHPFTRVREMASSDSTLASDGVAAPLASQRACLLAWG
jgi:hypothetical protein